MTHIGSICWHRGPRMAGFGIMVVLLLVAAGCATNQGSFSLDAEVTRAFQTGVIQPQYQYYYSGRDNMPYAIMAIDRSYTVPSRYWIAFQPTPEQLKNMSGNVYGKLVYDPYGALIRAADGQIVGAWYSNVPFRSVTVDQAAKTVQVLFPNPENDSIGASVNIPS